jgi:hypothetical protein
MGNKGPPEWFSKAAYMHFDLLIVCGYIHTRDDASRLEIVKASKAKYF